jgi:hypothetical protein
MYEFFILRFALFSTTFLGFNGDFEFILSIDVAVFIFFTRERVLEKFDLESSLEFSILDIIETGREYADFFVVFLFAFFFLFSFFFKVFEKALVPLETDVCTCKEEVIGFRHFKSNEPSLK